MEVTSIDMIWTQPRMTVTRKGSLLPAAWTVCLNVGQRSLPYEFELGNWEREEHMQISRNDK